MVAALDGGGAVGGVAGEAEEVMVAEEARFVVPEFADHCGGRVVGRGMSKMDGNDVVVSRGESIWGKKFGASGWSRR